MAKLPVISSRERITALAKIGFAVQPVRGKGSYAFMYRDDPPSGVTIPNEREIRRGTLRAILRHVGISPDDLLELLD